MEALTTARANGDKATAARLLGRIVTMRKNASKTQGPNADAKLSPFATQEEQDEHADRLAALAEMRADSAIVGFAPRPFHDIESEYRRNK